MSRLPRLHSSPDRMLPIAGPSASVTVRSGFKRKAAATDIDEDDEEATDQPRKLIAVQPQRRAAQILQPSRTAVNLAGGRGIGNGPPPLTKPQAPNFTAPRVARATSAPPKSGGPVRTTLRPMAASRVASGRTAGGVTGKQDDARFTSLQAQVSSIESARAADAARLAQEMEAERQKVANLQANHMALSRELMAARTQEQAQRHELIHTSDELESLKKKHVQEVMDLEMDMRRKEREIRELKEDLRLAQDELQRERETVSQLKATISQQSTAQLALTSQNHAIQAQLSAAQSALNMSSGSVSQLSIDLESARKLIAELQEEAHEAETLRRKLHNQIQELKGNIRVFCRVRPVLPSDMPGDSIVKSTSSASLVVLSDSRSPTPNELEKQHKEAVASIAFPDKRDHKEIVLYSSSESATGQERKETYNFAFDRVFEPDATQAEVFEEISQLAQSCVDGYNVCIFAYGQTGSGKSFTMEGGLTDELKGMIPRAVDRVFGIAEEYQSKGWEYKLEGQFLEIYNEAINDLLGKGEFDKKKHEIKHDKGTTRVTDVVVLPLQSPHQVRSLLSIAQSRRTVASTLMNERSSRSHSVFTLRITGTNKHTGETCEGSLNLVDLAGSERLNSSGAGSDKERLKETQSINKSLSALGDVIAALGEKGDGKTDKHIPYRNSKLTYLLQNSLSGNSKTLMVLNVSPLAAHLGESLCSLRFATKVNNTTLGTAKKQIRTS